MIFSILWFFCTLRFQIYKYLYLSQILSYHKKPNTSIEGFSISKNIPLWLVLWSRVTYTRASQQLITPTLTSNFGKLLHDLLLSFALGDGPHKQTIVGNRDAHTDVFPRANFIVVTLQERLQSESKRPQVDRNKQTITYEFDGLLSSLFSAEGDEGVSSVQPAERVHHQTQIPYGSGFLEQRD